MKQLLEFESRHAAAVAAADALAAAVAMQLARQPQASMVVSGGSSPLECLGLLANKPLEWGRVQVTLSDERCVAADHPDSNERMVRENLLVNAAAAATYAAPQQSLPEPFAAVLLGMGADGHFASLFPDAANLQAGLDLAQAAPVLDIQTASSPYQRITMPLARLLKTDYLMLLAFGNDKRVLIDEPGNTPVSALFDQNQCPIQVYWAP